MLHNVNEQQIEVYEAQKSPADRTRLRTLVYAYCSVVAGGDNAQRVNGIINRRNYVVRLGTSEFFRHDVYTNPAVALHACNAIEYLHTMS